MIDKEILNDGDVHKDSDEELIFNPYNSNNVESDFPDKDIFFDLEKLSINETSLNLLTYCWQINLNNIFYRYLL